MELTAHCLLGDAGGVAAPHVSPGRHHGEGHRLLRDVPPHIFRLRVPGQDLQIMV